MAPNRSVTYRMARCVLLVAFGLGVAIATILVVRDYHVRHGAMIKQGEQLLTAARNTAFQAVYSFDQELAAEIAKGLFEFPLVERVHILDEQDRMMMSVQRDMQPLPHYWIAQFLFKDRYIFRLPLLAPYGDDHQYGELIIHLSPKPVIEAFWQQVLSIFGGTLLQIGVVAILVLWICYRMVSRPLYRLVSQFNHIDPSAPAKGALSVDQAMKGAEFEAVIRAGNTMLDVISRQLQAKDTAQQIIRRQKEQTERYLAIAEAIIVQLDRDGKVMMLNQRGLDLLDYKGRDVIGQDWFELVIPTRNQCSERETYKRFIAGERGSLFYREGYVVTRRGQFRRIIWHVALDYNNRSEVTGVLCSGQDVTDLLATEAALRTSEGNLRRIIEATTQGFVVIDRADSTILDVNTALCQLLGGDRDEVIGTGFLSYVHPDDRADLSFHSDEASPRHEHLDIRLRTLQDQPLFVEIRLSNLVKGVDGTLQSVAFINDMTGRKNQEEKQKFLEDQLRQAQKMETIGTLAGGIAHDFNNILTPILGYATMLQDRLDVEDKNYSRVEKIAQSARRASDMVKKILTFSRRSEGEMHPIDLATIVAECQGLLEKAKPEIVSLEVTIPDTPVVILGDATQVQQAIMNLWTNAYQAFNGQTGAVSIVIGKRVPSEVDLLRSPVLKHKVYGYFQIKDTGEGMSAETVSRIFEPFYTTKKSGEGTGLGMAIVHGIVAGHNGEVFVSSSPDQGTECHVYFPLSSAKPQSLPQETIPLQGQGELVLIVDDEPLNGKFIAEVLEEAGYRYEVYSNSLNALDAYMQRAEDYALLLTDQTMPQLSGDQLVRAIHEVNADFPVIMMSGYDKTVDLENAQDFGVDVYLQKPVTPHDLLKTMTTVLNKKNPD